MRDRESGPGFTYERHSYYETNVRLQHNDFEIHFDGDETLYEESHVQRIYRLSDIEQRIEASPFELVELLASLLLIRVQKNLTILILRAPGTTT